MKGIATAELLLVLSCFLTVSYAYSDSDFVGIRGGTDADDTTTRTRLLLLDEEDQHPVKSNNDAVTAQHRRLQVVTPGWTYQLPPWWATIRDNFDGVNLKMCNKREIAPPIGRGCSTSAKTCFFGNQQCPAGVGSYPTERCFCDGDGRNYGSWSCETVECNIPSNEEDNFAPDIDLVGSISGTVFDYNSTNNVGDLSLSGITILLFDNSAIGNPPPFAQTVTDSGGYYIFNYLPAKEYRISQTNPPGWTDVSDSDGGELGSIIVNLQVPGTISVGNDFIMARRTDNVGSISGTVTEDINNDNVGDIPLDDITITLFDNSANGGNTLVAQTVTDSAGDYVFYDLLPQEYRVSRTNMQGRSDVSDSDGGELGTIMVNLQVPGTNSMDNNFVSVAITDPTVSFISGLLTEYRNTNNVGDLSLSGVTISLFDSSANGGTLLAQSVTDSTGYYVFYDLPAQDYRVSQTNLPGWTTVSDSDGGELGSIVVNLQVPDRHSFDSDFVIARTADIVGSISGSVSDDEGDSVHDVILRLIDTGGTIIATTLTDFSGRYRFFGLPQGTIYTVEQIPKPFWIALSDVDGGDGTVVTVDLTESEFATGIDFINKRIADEVGSINGRVTEYSVTDNVGDLSFSGVAISLFDSSANDGTLLAQTVTDSGGYYVFYDLPAQDYRVSQTNLPGWTTVSDSDGGELGSIMVNLQVPATNSYNNDFLIARIADIIGSISGSVSGDEGDSIPYVTLRLSDISGVIFASTLTDFSGRYLFSGFPQGGIYTVEQIPNPFWTVLSDVDGGDVTVVTVDLTESEFATSIDFINKKNTGAVSFIRGTVYDYLNADKNDGFQLSGLSMSLFDNSANGGALLAQTVTGPGSNYGFHDLPAQDYRVSPTTQPGWTTVSDSDGGELGSIIVNLQVPGAASESNDFFIARIADIVGFSIGRVSDDKGDSVPDVILRLIDISSAIIATTLTDYSGRYHFSGLSQGTIYTVELIPKPFWIALSDVDGGDVTVVTVDLTESEFATGIDFINKRIADEVGSISGIVFEDINLDSVEDLPLSGVTISLLDNSANGGTLLAQTLTDSGGYYVFNDLPAQGYRVSRTNRPGWADVSDSDGGELGSIIVNLQVPGTNSFSNDFVIAGITDEFGSISGAVTGDSNSDNVGDFPLVGVTVSLFYNIVNGGDFLRAQTVTDSGGDYVFYDLPPQDYRVSQEFLPDWATVSDSDGGELGTIIVNLQVPGTNSVGNNFISAGIATSEVGTISGIVTEEDTNNDNVGNFPVSGVTISLFDNSANGGTLIAQTVTDSGGYYDFYDLPAQGYRVSKTNLPGWTDVSDSDGGELGSIMVNLQQPFTDSRSNNFGVAVP